MIGNKELLDKRDGEFALDQGRLMIQQMTTWFKQSYFDLLPKLGMEVEILCNLRRVGVLEGMRKSGFILISNLISFFTLTHLNSKFGFVGVVPPFHK